MNPSSELYLSFIVQATSVTAINKDLIPSLVQSIAWLEKHANIPEVVYQSFKFLFDNYKVHRSHSIQDLQIMFALAKKTQASLQWISGVKEPFLLASNVGQMSLCAHAIEAIF